MRNKKTGPKDETSKSDLTNVKSWVFLSHSNLDYERVTFVRNVLERNNKRPIMFFLKCLEKENELNDLLKREIDARDQFILCDSENARRSKWVQDEVRYIKSKGRVYKTINLDDPDEIIEKEITSFVNRSKVYISYSRIDTPLAERVMGLLRQHGFDVFLDTNVIESGDNFRERVVKELDTSVKSGYLLILHSKSLMNSEWRLKELMYFSYMSGSTHKNGSNWIIPVMIDKAKLSDIFLFELATLPRLDVSMYNSPEEQAQKIVEFLVQRDHELSE